MPSRWDWRHSNVGPSAGGGGIVTYPDTTVSNNTNYWYRVFANGETVGDVSMAGFPTMSADSVSNTLPVVVGVATTVVPANPTLPDRDRASRTAGEPDVEGQRDQRDRLCGRALRVGAGCTSFAQIAAAGPRNNTGNVTYTDTTVTPATPTSTGCAAVNAVGPSLAPTNATTALVPAIPAAPTSFTVSVVKNPTGPNYTATLTWTAAANPTNFTIQRARNATFTTGLNTVNPGAAVRTITQTLAPNTTFYYRIRANNNISGSSAWTNALPFPIRTGSSSTKQEVVSLGEGAIPPPSHAP